MNGFKCNVSSSTSNVALAQPQVPRRCGADPDFQKLAAIPSNCTFGAKQPFYWFQIERNNMFEGPFAPPFYTDLYNFRDGAQNDIFVDSYIGSIPTPSPNQTQLPTLNLLGSGGGTVSSVPSSSASVLASNANSSSSSKPVVVIKQCKSNPSPSTLGKRDAIFSLLPHHPFFSVSQRFRKLNRTKRASLWRPF